MMASDDIAVKSSLTIPVDPDHGGLRFAVIVIFVVLVFVLYFLINLILPAEGFNIIALIVALIATYFVLQQIEKRLKQRWPSGRVVEMDEQRVRVGDKGKVQSEIDTEQQVNVLMWRFKIKRQSRVPKGWYVVACSLEQDNRYLSVYTFMPPAQFDQMKIARHFTELVGKKELEKQSMERDLRLAGQQRRLHAAETHRWMEGAEMSIQDFETFIARLQTQFPRWMPSS